MAIPLWPLIYTFLSADDFKIRIMVAIIKHEISWKTKTAVTESDMLSRKDVNLG